MNGGSDENASPSYSHTNGGWNSGTGVYTPGSGDPSASGVTVGQFACVFPDGTTTPSAATCRWARVTAVSSTTVTLSTTAGVGSCTTAGSGRSLNVGGCFKGPNGSVSFPFNFNFLAATNSSGDEVRINLKNNATYSISSGISHGQSGAITFQGYSSTPGDLGKATIDCSTNAVNILAVGQAYLTFADLILSSSATTGTNTGFSASGGAILVLRVVAAGCRGAGFSMSGGANGNILVECEAYDCNKANTAGSAGFTSAGGNTYLRCISHGNSGSNASGFSSTSASNATDVYIDCIAADNGDEGFRLTSDWIRVLSCNAYDNGGDGLRWMNTTRGNAYIENCNFVKNGGYGITYNTTRQRGGSVVNCGFGGGTDANTSGNGDLESVDITGSISYTSNPWVDPGNGNFDLNAVAGDGSSARGAGAGSFTQDYGYSDTTASYPDVGAAQHQETAGGSALFIPVVNTILG